jgi:hypothetical protein
MPRNDLKAYETLTARIPQDLVDAARRYASLHRCTVSELIRDSLQMYLDADDADRASGQEVLQDQTEVIQEVLHKVLQGQTEVIQEVRQGHTALAQAIAALAAQGQTEVIHATLSPAGGRTEVLQGHTSQIKAAPGVDAYGQTEVVPAHTPGADCEGITEVIQRQTEVIPPEPVPSFDPVKYRLGKLCPRGHDYQGTGQSLRKNTKAGGCLACDAEQARERRQAKRQEVSA